MTNKERDALLISMSKGINNLYKNFFSLEKNLQKKIEDTSEKTENNLRSEIKNTENRLRAEFKTEIKNTENRLRAEFKTEIKNTENTLRAEIKNTENTLRAEIKNTEDKLRAEIKNTEDKLRDEMNSQNQINITSIVDAFHETWRIDSRERNIINKRLDQHDKEIKVLKERLA